jgi:Protein of unknown function with HXXEE motif
MNFFRRHWYEVGAVVAIGTVVWLILGWHGMDILQRLLLLNFVALLVHQYEEYGWPGGGPGIVNIVMRPNPAPDRYPLNQNSAMMINVFAAYHFYVLPVFFPEVIWLGLAPVVFGLLQFVVHGIVVNVKMKSLYNPGLAAVVVGHIPIGLYYLYYVHAHDLVIAWDWVLALVYMLTFQYVLMLKLGYGWLADRNSRFPFAEAEMRRFSVPEKLARLIRKGQSANSNGTL